MFSSKRAVKWPIYVMALLAIQAQGSFTSPPALREINHLEDVTPEPPYASPIISDLCVHVDGTRYIGGKIRGDVDLDPGPGLLVISDDWGDPFVAIYPVDGAPQVHQFFNDQGGTAAEVLDMALDSDGNVYVLGSFDADWLVVGDGLPDLPGSNGTPFLAKINPMGEVQWAFSLPGNPSSPTANTLGVNDERLVIGGLIGRFAVDFDPDPKQQTWVAADDIRAPDPYFASYDLDGDFLWARVIRQTTVGPNTDGIGALRFTQNNQLLVGGAFASDTDFRDDGGSYLLSSDHTDAFIGLFGADGLPLWVQQIGGIGATQARIEELDHNGNMITVAGAFLGQVDFDPDGVDSYHLNSNPINSFDRFIAAYDMSGGLLWANLIDSSQGGLSWGNLTVSESGASVMAGTASHLGSGVDFDPGVGDSGNSAGGFLAFYAQDGAYLSAHTFGGPANVFMTDVLWDGESTIHASGRFVNPVDIDPGMGETWLVPTTPVGAEMFFGTWGDLIFKNGFE